MPRFPFSASRGGVSGHPVWPRRLQTVSTNLVSSRIHLLFYRGATPLRFANMRIADLIYKKAQRGELSDEEVRFFISELVAGRVEDSQLGNI